MNINPPSELIKKTHHETMLFDGKPSYSTINILHGLNNKRLTLTLST